jgi:hypothetical protein
VVQDAGLPGLVVVGRDQKQRVGAELLGLLGQLDAVGRRVAADAGDHGRLVTDGVLDDTQDVAHLGHAAGRALPRRAAHHDAVMAVLEEVVGDRRRAVQVDGAVVGERRRHRREHPPEGRRGRHGVRLLGARLASARPARSGRTSRSGRGACGRMEHG